MKKILITLSALTLSTAAFAEGGSHVGNGGSVWTCRDNTSAHTLVWSELMDLSEGRRELKLNIPKDSPLTRDEWITAVEKKIRDACPFYFAEYQVHMAKVREKFTPVQDSDFERVDDAYNRTAPDREKFCPNGTIQPEQLANYTHQGHLIINDEIWSSATLPEIDHAALYIHEAIYSLLREREGATDSVKTRELVADLFSDKPLEEYVELLLLPPRVITPAPSPAPTAHPAPSGPVIPNVGLYRATAGDWVNIEITYFNSKSRTLFLTQRDLDNGKDMSNQVFVCDSVMPEMTCNLIETTNHATKDFWRHHLKISEANTFVWMNTLKNGVTRATRYRR